MTGFSNTKIVSNWYEWGLDSVRYAEYEEWFTAVQIIHAIRAQEIVKDGHAVYVSLYDNMVFITTHDHHESNIHLRLTHDLAYTIENGQAELCITHKTVGDDAQVIEREINKILGGAA